MQESIIVVNAGSSTFKFSVFETLANRSLRAGAHGQVEGIGASPRLEVADPSGRKLGDCPIVCGDQQGAIKAIHQWFSAHIGSETGLNGVGHRVVHGGLTYSEPMLIDEDA